MIRLPKLNAIHLHPPKSLNYNLNSFHSENSSSLSWNDKIRAYATRKGDSQREAIHVFLSMRRSKAMPNDHTFPFLFKACASFSGLIEGRQIHGDVIKHGLASNLYVQNTLIHFYGTCKKIVNAREVFNEMSVRSISSWNSIINVYIENRWFHEAISCFVTMRKSGFQPDETTMVILLSVSGELGNLSFGKWIHSQLILKGMDLNVQLGTAIVNMYGKCGVPCYARLVFNKMSTRNVWTWSSMILGLAQNGFAIEALNLFSLMKKTNILPNHVTYLGILSACSHSGLVSQGKLVFQEMQVLYNIKPNLSHYGAMVDILTRAGLFNEAYSLIQNMPIKADATIWRTLLSACNCNKLAEKVKQELFKLEPRRSGNFIMLANKYAGIGLWEKSIELRKSMRHKGLKKRAGESCVEINGSMYRFFSGDDWQVGCEEIFLLLDKLNLHIKIVNNILLPYCIN